MRLIRVGGRSRVERCLSLVKNAELPSPMAQYQACFINHANSIVAIENFEAPDDAAAIAHARAAYGSGNGKGYELWEGSRHFHSMSYQNESLREGRRLDVTLPLGETFFVGQAAAIPDTPSHCRGGLWRRLFRNWCRTQAVK